MIGIILALFGTLLLEVSTVIGKGEVKLQKETIYSFGFLGVFWSVIWFLVIILFHHSFSFSLNSLLTFLPRAVLEILLIEVSIRAIVTADRSTYSFLRIITIPLLLFADLWLGYSLGPYQILGIIIICLTLAATIYVQAINKRGLKLVIASAILAVFTISLYKYDITHFNNVETEQFLIYSILLIYFLIKMKLARFGNPFKLLVKHPYASQSIAQGLAGVITSFAFVFAPASIIITAERSLTILWAVLSGKLYFKEKHTLVKIGIFIILGFGIYLLTL